MQIDVEEHSLPLICQADARQSHSTNREKGLVVPSKALLINCKCCDENLENPGQKCRVNILSFNFS